MPISTAKTYLFYNTTGATFVKLTDIIDYPDLGSAPAKIDTTDLSATKMKTFINGLQEAPDMTFTANYDKTVYATIKGLEGTSKKYQVHFGTDGVDGKFEWTGQVTVWATGAGVDEARRMTIQISVETQITVS